MIVDSSLQHLQEDSSLFEKIVDFLRQVIPHSLFDMFFSSIVLEEAVISFDTGTFEQVSEIPVIFEIPSPSRGCISLVPFPLFLPKGRNII